MAKPRYAQYQEKSKKTVVDGVAPMYHAIILTNTIVNYQPNTSKGNALVLATARWCLGFRGFCETSTPFAGYKVAADACRYCRTRIRP